MKIWDRQEKNEEENGTVRFRSIEIPDSDAVEQELERERNRRNYRRALRSTLGVLLCVFAAALLAATLLLPVVRVYGSSMHPRIMEGDIVVCRKTENPGRGRVLACYYNNKLVLRRVIGLPGDTIDINEQGQVEVNGELLEENYITEASFGDSDIEYPYTVPDGRYFVLADNRAGAKDSRHDVFGCVEKDNLIGVVFFRVWPLPRFGIVR